MKANNGKKIGIKRNTSHRRNIHAKDRQRGCADMGTIDDRQRQKKRNPIR